MFHFIFDDLFQHAYGFVVVRGEESSQIKWDRCHFYFESCPQIVNQLQFFVVEFFHQTLIVVMNFTDAEKLILLKLLETFSSIVNFGIVKNWIVEPLPYFSMINS
mgnify:CR=1 FL=1